MLTDKHYKHINEPKRLNGKYDLIFGRRNKK